MSRLGLWGITFLLVASGNGWAATPAAAQETVIGRARYDSRIHRIVVPFRGAAPEVQAFHLSDTHHYFEFTRSQLQAHAVQNQLLPGAVQRVTLAERPAARVRLSFKLERAGHPVVVVDARAHVIHIWPLGDRPDARVRAIATTPTPRPSATPTARVATPTPRPSATPTARVATPTPRPSATPTARVATPAPRPSLTPSPHPSHVRAGTPASPRGARRTSRPLVRAVYLDLEAQELAIPYSEGGATPQLTWVRRQRLWDIYDIQGARVPDTNDSLQGTLGEPGILWLLGPGAKADTVRLYLKMQKPEIGVKQLAGRPGELRFKLVTLSQPGSPDPVDGGETEWVGPVLMPVQDPEDRKILTPAPEPSPSTLP